MQLDQCKNIVVFGKIMPYCHSVRIGQCKNIFVGVVEYHIYTPKYAVQEYFVFSARIPYSQSGQLVLASYRHVGEDFSFHHILLK